MSLTVAKFCLTRRTKLNCSESLSVWENVSDKTQFIMKLTVLSRWLNLEGQFAKSIFYMHNSMVTVAVFTESRLVHGSGPNVVFEPGVTLRICMAPSRRKRTLDTLPCSPLAAKIWHLSFERYRNCEGRADAGLFRVPLLTCSQFGRSVRLFISAALPLIARPPELAAGNAYGGSNIS